MVKNSGSAKRLSTDSAVAESKSDYVQRATLRRLSLSEPIRKRERKQRIRHVGCRLGETCKQPTARVGENCEKFFYRQRKPQVEKPEEEVEKPQVDELLSQMAALEQAQREMKKEMDEAIERCNVK